jgi:hypothetical protein
MIGAPQSPKQAITGSEKNNDTVNIDKKAIVVNPGFEKPVIYTPFIELTSEFSGSLANATTSLGTAMDTPQTDILPLSA